MRNELSRFITLLGLAVLLAAPAAFAQASDKLVADIPFDFTVAARTHPAGQYEFVPTAQRNVLVIRTAEGRGVEVACALPQTGNGARTEAKLIFHRYGSQYFLSQVWGIVPGSWNQLPKSKMEKELMATSARAGATTVAARRP